MRVVNVAVGNREYFLDILAGELISNGISYVQIENEFHFLNHIYRFYDINQDLDKIITLLENRKITDSVSSIFEFFDSKEKNADSSLGVMAIDDKYKLAKDEVKDHPKNLLKINIKKMIKHQNKMVNQRTRQNVK